MRRQIMMFDNDKILKCKNPVETKNYQQLGDHPNFLKYYGVKDDCIILEYIPNVYHFEDLFGSAPANFGDIVAQSFTALDYLHSRGLYHGDLGNAKNILYDRKANRVIIIDLEGGPITDNDGVYWDNRDMAFILWIVLDGDVDQDIYEAMNDSDYSLLVNHIVESRSNYKSKDTQDAISIILARLTNITAR